MIEIPVESPTAVIDLNRNHISALYFISIRHVVRVCRVVLAFDGLRFRATFIIIESYRIERYRACTS